MSKIKVESKIIGRGAPCFITVDIGANHNRDFNTALKLIDYAVKAGVDAVKFQVYSADTLYSKKVPKHSHYNKNFWKLIKKIEMPREWIPRLKSYCDKKKIIFFATPFDYAAVDELEPYVSIYKISSFELTDIPLVKYIAQKRKPIIISTGLATMKEIEDAYSACIQENNHKIAFLHCASLYPAAPDIMNLRAMKTIEDAFDVPVGLSDHTRGTHIAVSAIALGAKIIEKHFTLSRKMIGPDHSFAIEPAELINMTSQMRDIESALGSGKKTGPHPEEMENFRIGRRSIHARIAIALGQRITEEMLIVKRPGYGICPALISNVIGKTAKRNIETDEWLTWKMV
ncbi:MAG: N-acetylneuraminate synthase family protein [Candidatus Omnitrophica bacterium]|nr:N-acetylneuraminate synthase family protein [Candidatus Omnitrophota bacterium]MBU1808347.1 N-acetylneuraminate synthase family protein [Candidatus Omnitrophota bacterium]